MKQGGLDALLGLKAGATDNPSQQQVASAALSPPFRQIHLCLQGKGDYAVAELVAHLRRTHDFPICTRGVYVPPHDGSSYMRFDNSDQPGSPFHALEEFYASGNFRRLPCGLLSQEYPSTEFDWLQACGWTMEGCAAAVLLGTKKTLTSSLTTIYHKVAGTLGVPLILLEYPTTRRKKRDIDTERRERLQRLGALHARVADAMRSRSDTGVPNGHVMVVNMLNGTHPNHLRYLLEVVPLLIGMSANAVDEWLAREPEEEVFDQVACRFNMVPDGIKFKNRRD